MGGIMGGCKGEREGGREDAVDKQMGCSQTSEATGPRLLSAPGEDMP